ncbi:MAG: hypothetical protein AAF941_10230 [Pseudomonadota bacterium]
MAYLVRTVLFLGMVALGLWGFAVLDDPWGWIAFGTAFLVGGVASMIAFKRLATHEQIKEDLEARLRND